MSVQVDIDPAVDGDRIERLLAGEGHVYFQWVISIKQDYCFCSDGDPCSLETPEVMQWQPGDPKVRFTANGLQTN